MYGLLAVPRQILTDYPCARTPGRGETSDEHAGRYDHDDPGRLVFRRRSSDTDRRKDQKPDGLPERAVEQGGPSSDFFQPPEAWNSTDHVDLIEMDQVVRPGCRQSGNDVVE